MNHWVFSQFSFGSAIVMLISAAAAVFLYTRKPRRKGTSFLSHFFLCMFFSAAGRFTAYTLYHPIGRFGTAAEAVFFLIALLFLLQAAYHLPGRTQKNEPDLALIITGAAVMCTSILYIYRAVLAAPSLDEHGYSPGRQPVLFLITQGVLSIWITLVFIRNTAAFADRTYKDTSTGNGRIAAAVRPALDFTANCFFPQSNIARAARALAAAVLLFACSAYMQFIPGAVPAQWTAPADTAVSLIFVAVSVIIIFAWINTSRDAVSLLYSASGLTAALMISAVGITALLTFGSYTRDYDALKIKNIELITPMLESGENVFAMESDIAFIIGTSRASGYLSSSYMPEYIRNPLTFNDVIRVFNAERDTAMSRETAVLRDQYPLFEPWHIRRLALMAVASSETVLLRRSFITVSETGFYRYYFAKDDMLYCIGFEYIAYRKNIHRIAVILIAGLFIMTAASVAASAVFFHLRIEGPVQRLAEAVIRLNDEGKARNRTVEREDEIGFLARSFNIVLGSLREARRDAALSASQKAEYAQEVLRAKQKSEHLALKNESLLRTLDDSSRALSDAHRRISGDAELTAHMQQRVLPQQPPDIKDWQIAFTHRSIAPVSSDLYDFYLCDRTLDGFALFSVSGHGAAKGLLTLIVRSALFRAFRSSRSKKLSAVMETANREMIAAVKDLPFSISGILLRTGGSTVEYTNASHPGIILYCAKTGEAALPGGSFKEPAGHLLGLDMDNARYGAARFTVSRGDMIIAFSPALLHRSFKTGKSFTHAAIAEALTGSKNSSAQSALDSLCGAFEICTGIPDQGGDITIIVAKKL